MLWLEICCDRGCGDGGCGDGEYGGDVYSEDGSGDSEYGDGEGVSLATVSRVTVGRGWLRGDTIISQRPSFFGGGEERGFASMLGVWSLIECSIELDTSR